MCLEPISPLVDYLLKAWIPEYSKNLSISFIQDRRAIWAIFHRSGKMLEKVILSSGDLVYSACVLCKVSLFGSGTRNVLIGPLFF
ncbi:hypothetical protein RIR_jg7668.t1 [Rhizophagus irregularis DAOM 181602=DAOM 197198]|nr:hypothetical protein RIR_jg7668.t1 [Rhizophagus irregularis DAOM 181602=DAOM 197198]